MKRDVESERVHLAVRRHAADFETNDVQQKRPVDGKFGQGLPIPVPRRTVFQPESDWRGESSSAVLSALKSAFREKVVRHQDIHEVLRLSRCAGAVPVDARIADLFESHIGYKGFSSEGFQRAVQCAKCRRPVLTTRFAAHFDACHSNASSVTCGLMASDDTSLGLRGDTQLDLVCRSNRNVDMDEKRAEVEKETTRLMQCGEMSSSEHGENCQSLPTRACLQKLESERIFQFPREEDEWEDRLPCLAVKYVPRASSAKRRRVSLPVPCESTVQRKRNLNIEKKSLLAAGASGIYSLNAARKQNQMLSRDPQDDSIRQTVESLGGAAPWSKLMQIAMPVTVPRTQRMKIPSSDFHSAAKVAGSPSSPAVGSVSNSVGHGRQKSNEATDKNAACLASSAPSLVGSLLWLRAQGMKELIPTPLYSIDNPHLPIAKHGTIFHGQTYVAELGTFETDPRTQTSIKMPLGTGQTVHNSMKGSPVTITGSKSSAVAEVKSKKSQQSLSSANPSHSHSLPQPPTSKKQRTTKGQRSQVSGASGQNINGTSSSKPLHHLSRKQTNSRTQTQAGNRSEKSSGDPVDIARRAASSRTMPNGSSGVVINTGIALASSAGADNRYETPHLLQQQKKPFRTANVSGPTIMTPRGTVAQPLPMTGASGSGSQMQGNAAGRINKPRSHAASMVNSSAASRSGGYGKGRAASPSQNSSRSGDRLSLHRGSPMSTGPYEPVTVPPASPGIADMNRIAGMPTGSGKQQMGFQQAMAQVAAKGIGGTDRDVSSLASSRGMLQQNSSKGQGFGAGKVQSPNVMQRGNMRGVPSNSRGPQNGVAQSSQGRHVTGHKNNGRQVPRVPLHKETRNPPPQLSDLDTLRRTEGLPVDVMGVKQAKGGDPILFTKRPERNNVMMNHAAHESQGFYSAAMAGLFSQAGSAAALTNPTNPGLLRLAQANQNAGAIPSGRGNPMMQSMDMRSFSNLGVQPDMAAGAHNANVLGFLHANGLGGGVPHTASVSTPLAPGMRAGGLPNATNLAMLSPSDAILQQLLSAGRASGLNPMPQTHGQAGLPHGGPISTQQHQVARSGTNIHGIGHNIQPVHHTAPHTAIDEIDRALGLSFEESDLMD